MAQVTEAVFSGGVLKPATELSLRDEQRVRLIIEPLEERPENRAEALKQLLAGIESMQFISTRRLPTRDELHDRD